MTLEATHSALTSIAAFADLPISEAELETLAPVLENYLTIMRSTPNEALEGIEPVTIFRHLPTDEIIPARPLSEMPIPEPKEADNELAFLTITEAAALLKTKKLSPVELTQAVLARIQAVNPVLEAFVTTTPELAIEAANLAEKEISNGNWRGPLHGVTLALKDIVETKGIRTTGSSKVLPDYVPANDAAVAEKLAAAGTVLVGKVHTHEFALGMITPPTKNPYNPQCIPGGSSGGSGSAVASGMAAMAIGTDTGGSIRIPAAFCGTVGLKPTYGRVSRRGIFSLSWSLDHAGPMTRSIEDAALMLQAIAGFDPLDGASAPVAVPDFTATLKDGVKGLKIGVCRGEYFEKVQPAVHAAVMEAAKVLESLGAKLIDVEIPNIEEAYAINMMVALAEASSFHQKWLRTKAALYNPDVRTYLQTGELVLATDYLQAQRRRGIFTKGVLAVLKEVDLLLLASMPIVAPKIGQSEISYPGYSGLVTEICIKFTGPFNCCGLPALSVPCGFSEGLPIGLQLVGRPFEEGLVLQGGYAFEQATAWHKHRPNL